MKFYCLNFHLSILTKRAEIVVYFKIYKNLIFVAILSRGYCLSTKVSQRMCVVTKQVVTENPN